MRWSTTLARPLDLQAGTNRLIAACMVAGLLVGGLHGWLRGSSGLPILVAGLSLALTVFLSWALTRELDPDGEASAFLAAGLASAGWLWLGDSDLWAAGVALLLSRMVARTVGSAASLGDGLLVLALVGVLAMTSGRWSLAVAGALAFSLDALLIHGRRSRLAFAGLAVGVSVAGSWAAGLGWQSPAHPVLVGVVTAVALGHISTLPPPAYPCDDGEHRLHRQRIQGAGAVALSIVVLSSLEPGPTHRAAIVAAGLLAAGLGRMLPRRFASTERPGGGYPGLGVGSPRRRHIKVNGE